MQFHEKYPDNNDEKLGEVSKPSEWIIDVCFPIINPHKNVFLFR